MYSVGIRVDIFVVFGEEKRIFLKICYFHDENEKHKIWDDNVIG